MQGAFCYLFDELGCNEICLWQNKSAYADEIRLRRVMVADFISPEACLGFHLNVVKISSAFADFITVGDFIFFRRPIYFLPFLWYDTTNR